MGEDFTSGLIVPAIVLALLGWLVPRLLSLVFPEGVRPLLALAFVATLILFMLSTAVFLALYLLQGVPFAALFADGWAPGLLHFGYLGLLSAMLWGPILIVSVAGLPRTWVEETW